VVGVAGARKIGELGLMAGMALFGVTGKAAADVIEIAPDGAVKIYDRPMVITADTQTEIIAPVIASPSRRDVLAPLLNDSAERAGVAPDLVEAVAWAESRFNPDAVSHRGAIGPMQLMPATAKEIGVDPFDIAQNIDGGARYLRKLIDTFDGDVNLALAAYNAGPAAVRAHGGTPPYRETQAYVAKVLGYMASKAVAQ
jgi:soluble lytic murein transglycosylase-like protein